MYRNVLMSALALSAVTIATAAAAQSGDRSYHIPMTSNARDPLGVGPTDYAALSSSTPMGQALPNKWQVGQLVRWGEVGKCVAAKDRDASLSYVVGDRRSPMVSAAAKRLAPVFAACLTGSGIVQKGNKGYRRAAVADALGVRLSAGS